MPDVLPAQLAILTACLDLDPAEGITARDAGCVLRPDLATGNALGTAVGDAGRHIKMMVDAGLMELVQRGHWYPTEEGLAIAAAAEPPEFIPPAPPKNRSHTPHPPVLDKLPEGPDDHTPAGSRSRGARVRRLRDVLDTHADTVDPEQRAKLSTAIAVHGLDDWEMWLPAMFPKVFTSGFAPHHEEFWNWVWGIEADTPVNPFVGVWNRGGAKSVSAEAALVALAARQRRKYALYVSGTQTLADEHVANIGGLLESPELSAAYPALGSRAVGKYGESKGWRRNRLRTQAGFTVDALGLDVAARGARIDEQRPDVIVLDDVDSENDTPATVEKKIRTITRKLLPAGTANTAVIAIQNVIHSNSIFARLCHVPGAPRADFLSKRYVSGPIPALWGMEWRQEGDSYVISGGEPTWEGMDLAGCQAMLDLIGLTSFLIECQHEEADIGGGMFDHLDFEAIRVTRAEVPVLRKVACWVDPAVTSTNKSDSCGIVVDGLGADRRIYRLWSWERIASPVEALRVGILAAIEFGATVIGVETDQGGDTWESVYRSALAALMDEGAIPDGVIVPRFESAKAGSVGLAKVDRAAQMLAAYELGRFRHVEGGCGPLEGGLRRFPVHKPFDVVDAAYWGFKWLGGNEGPARGTKMRVPRGKPVPDVSASALL